MVVDTHKTENMRTVSWSWKDKSIDVGDPIVPAAASYALRLNDGDGIVTLAEQVASVWWLNSRHEFQTLFKWPEQKDFRVPYRSVRVPRVLI